jgi:hypothetical protein
MPIPEQLQFFTARARQSIFRLSQNKKGEASDQASPEDSAARSEQ